jgi:hypothetical protein
LAGILQVKRAEFPIYNSSKMPWAARSKEIGFHNLFVAYFVILSIFPAHAVAIKTETISSA